jgi:hypothetical protein
VTAFVNYWENKFAAGSPLDLANCQERDYRLPNDDERITIDLARQKKLSTWRGDLEIAAKPGRIWGFVTGGPFYAEAPDEAVQKP